MFKLDSIIDVGRGGGGGGGGCVGSIWLPFDSLFNKLDFVNDDEDELMDTALDDECK